VDVRRQKRRDVILSERCQAPCPLFPASGLTPATQPAAPSRLHAHRPVARFGLAGPEARAPVVRIAAAVVPTGCARVGAGPARAGGVLDEGQVLAVHRVTPTGAGVAHRTEALPPAQRGPGRAPAHAVGARLSARARRPARPAMGGIAGQVHARARAVRLPRRAFRPRRTLRNSVDHSSR
jgi:hypothetical protein